MPRPKCGRYHRTDSTAAANLVASYPAKFVLRDNSYCRLGRGPNDRSCFAQDFRFLRFLAIVKLILMAGVLLRDVVSERLFHAHARIHRGLADRTLKHSAALLASATDTPCY